MKWFILMMLISCGKHQEPGFKDYQDSDGDQVLNYEESALDRYVADVAPLGKVEGVIRFNVDRPIEVELSNSEEVQLSPLELMVKNEKKLQVEDYFAEWSKLRVVKEVDLPELKLSQYTVYLTFSSDSDHADEILFIRGEEKISFGGWKSDRVLKISSQDLLDLLSGKAHFFVKKKYKTHKFFPKETEATIRNKTYKLHLDDGQKRSIQYVSKELKIEEFLKLKGINPEVIPDEDLFFYIDSLSEEKKWYLREFLNGEKVLVFTSINKLKKKFLENYRYAKKVVERINGVSQNQTSFQIPENSNAYFRISHYLRTERTFVESRTVRNHGGRGGGGREGNAEPPYSCTHFLRSIQNETSLSPGFTSLFNEVKSNLDLVRALEKMTDSGLSWEIKADQLNEVIFHLDPRAANTYTTTGEYRNSCPSGAITRGVGRAYSTNSEGKLSFILESYIEKM